MGCGASTTQIDRDDVYRRRIHEAAGFSSEDDDVQQHSGKKGARVGDMTPVERSARSLDSEHKRNLQIHKALDRRSSDGRQTTEGGEFVQKIRRRIKTAAAYFSHGINDDINQFSPVEGDAEDLAEFSAKRRRAVTHWCDRVIATCIVCCQTGLDVSSAHHEKQQKKARAVLIRHQRTSKDQQQGVLLVGSPLGVTGVGDSVGGAPQKPTLVHRRLQQSVNTASAIITTPSSLQRTGSVLSSRLGEEDDTSAHSFSMSPTSVVTEDVETVSASGTCSALEDDALSTSSLDGCGEHGTREAVFAGGLLRAVADAMKLPGDLFNSTPYLTLVSNATRVASVFYYSTSTAGMRGELANSGRQPHAREARRRSSVAGVGSQVLLGALPQRSAAASTTESPAWQLPGVPVIDDVDEGPTSTTKYRSRNDAGMSFSPTLSRAMSTTFTPQEATTTPQPPGLQTASMTSFLHSIASTAVAPTVRPTTLTPQLQQQYDEMIVNFKKRLVELPQAASPHKGDDPKGESDSTLNRRRLRNWQNLLTDFKNDARRLTVQLASPTTGPPEVNSPVPSNARTNAENFPKKRRESKAAKKDASKTARQEVLSDDSDADLMIMTRHDLFEENRPTAPAATISLSASSPPPTLTLTLHPESMVIPRGRLVRRSQDGTASGVPPQPITNAMTPAFSIPATIKSPGTCHDSPNPTETDSFAGKTISAAPSFAGGNPGLTDLVNSKLFTFNPKRTTWHQIMAPTTAFSWNFNTIGELDNVFRLNAVSSAIAKFMMVSCIRQLLVIKQAMIDGNASLLIQSSSPAGKAVVRATRVGIPGPAVVTSGAPSPPTAPAWAVVVMEEAAEESGPSLSTSPRTNPHTVSGNPPAAPAEVVSPSPAVFKGRHATRMALTALFPSPSALLGLLQDSFAAESSQPIAKPSDDQQCWLAYA